ncbi:MAG TPA: PD-(D/E)XK nuclease family protein, partial [Syntrophorhabdaceae bacterium]|nr:PD-(D/E)XK nuclease family protein [Syntrophorhabdaceae bacterium]
RVTERQFELRQTSGDYYLFKKLSAFKLESFLKKNVDQAEEPFVIKSLEMKVEEIMDVGAHPIRIKGRIDRIDYGQQTGVYTIMDYKTGGAKQYSQNIVKRTDFQSMQSIHEEVNSFQLPLYVYLFAKCFSIPLEKTEASLILLRNNEREDLFGGLALEEKQILFSSYMDGVATVIKDILDPAKPFAPFDADSCKTCEFSGLCHM